MFFLPNGLDFTDEGLYCSDAWRFAQGDSPFLDSLGAFGLSSWWLSWVFHVFPGCGLLDLRVVWAITMLLYAFVTAALLLRYFSPITSFAGAAIGLFFATSGTTKVLNYNTMPILGLLVAVWLWLFACRQRGKFQLLLAGGAGVAAFLATTCRISLLPIVLLPVSTVLYDYFCGIKMEGRLQTIIAFLATYIGGLACFFLAVFIAGLSGNLFASLVASTTVPGHSLHELIVNLRDSTFYYLLPAIPILFVLFIKRFRSMKALIKQHKRIVLCIIVPVLISCLAIVVLNWDATFKVAGWLKRGILDLSLDPFARPSRGSLLFLLALAIALVLANTIFHVFYSRLRKEGAKTHDIYRLGFIAVFLSFLMIPGTNNVPASSIKAISYLPLAMAFCLSWSWVLEQKKGAVNINIRWFAGIALVFLSLVYLFYGIVPGCYPYRDSYVGELTGHASATKLCGIITTSERAHIADQLIEAVKSNSEPGDRILAYENLPMLYYLTDRLPSVKTTWLTETFPKSLRESILEDMINRDRLPQLVIRATYTTRNPRWPEVQRPLYWKGNQQETDPIDKYVREHYKVLQDVDGFQIMVPME